MSQKRIGIKHFTASALIEHQGRFLLLYHQKLGMWLYPGGHIEANEEPQDALIREIEEETELSVSILSCGLSGGVPLALPMDTVSELETPLTILCERIPEKDGGHHWHIDMIYLCSAQTTDLSKLDGRSDIKWVTPQEAEALSCPPELSSLMRRGLAVLSVDRCHLSEGPARRAHRLRRPHHRGGCQHRWPPRGAWHGDRHVRGRADLDGVPAQANAARPAWRQARRFRCA